MAKTGANWRTIVLVVVLLISFILLGIGIAFYGNTLTKWWVPVMPAAVVAAVTVPVLAPRWRSLTESGSMI